MAEYPALPLWTDAYLADTRHLTTREHGAYLLLMMEAWRRRDCSLPDDDRLLARLSGLSDDEWREVKAVVMPLWSFDKRSRKYRQKRLLRERQFLNKKSEIARDAAASRWNRKKKTHASALPNGCQTDAPTPTPTPTPITPLNPPKGGDAREPEKAKSRARSETRKPEDVLAEVVDRQTARDFVEHRNRMRKPMTERAAEQIARKLGSARDPTACALASIENGWAGVFPENPKAGGTADRKVNPTVAWLNRNRGGSS